MDEIDTFDPQQASTNSSLLVRPRHVVLTVLFHPDIGRVGELAWLPPYAFGTPVAVSRQTPDFAPPHVRSGRPLDTPVVSRRPFTLAVTTDGDVIISCVGSGTEVQLAGEPTPIGTTRTISGAELAVGVQLILGRRVVLLLHSRAPLLETRPRDHAMVGANEHLERLRAQIDTAGPSRAPVLIRGETGAGKELVARALHDASPRARGPFVAVNLAAVTSSLAASELFGHVRGAFSGARRDRDGYFAQAHGGTLFLDELGECKPEIQAMLLRALETGEIQPVGASRARSVDVRLLAATDAKLEDMVAAGSFRAPLYYRFASHELARAAAARATRRRRASAPALFGRGAHDAGCARAAALDDRKAPVVPGQFNGQVLSVLVAGQRPSIAQHHPLPGERSGAALSQGSAAARADRRAQATGFGRCVGLYPGRRADRGDSTRSARQPSRGARETFEQACGRAR